MSDTVGLVRQSIALMGCIVIPYGVPSFNRYINIEQLYIIYFQVITNECFPMTFSNIIYPPSLCIATPSPCFFSLSPL